ncbi:MAG: hypothetical protein QNK37_25240 [Acidobacteriota bacterium]|nr:hypothetical protein [Acidobacteriota bacterium]
MAYVPVFYQLNEIAAHGGIDGVSDIQGFYLDHQTVPIENNSKLMKPCAPTQAFQLEVTP